MLLKLRLRFGKKAFFGALMIESGIVRNMYLFGKDDNVHVQVVRRIFNNVPYSRNLADFKISILFNIKAITDIMNIDVSKDKKGVYRILNRNQNNLYDNKFTEYIGYAAWYLNLQEGTVTLAVPSEINNEIIEDAAKLIKNRLAGFPAQMQQTSINPIMKKFSVDRYSFHNCAESTLADIINVILQMTNVDFVNNKYNEGFIDGIKNMFANNAVSASKWSEFNQDLPFVVYSNVYYKNTNSKIVGSYIKGFDRITLLKLGATNEGDFYALNSYTFVANEDRDHYFLYEIDPTFYSFNSFIRLLFDKDFQPSIYFDEENSSKNLGDFLKTNFGFHSYSRDCKTVKIFVNANCSFNLKISFKYHAEYSNPICRKLSDAETKSILSKYTYSSEEYSLDHAFSLFNTSKHDNFLSKFNIKFEDPSVSLKYLLNEDYEERAKVYNMANILNYISYSRDTVKKIYTLGFHKKDLNFQEAFILNILKMNFDELKHALPMSFDRKLEDFL